MLLLMMALTMQTAAPSEPPQIEIPDSALRDPYGFILSHCSPLVRRSGESLEACEYRVGEALRARLPGFRTRPPATMVASGADDPAAPTGTAFGGRCTTSQDSRRNADGSSSSGGMVICGDTESRAGARLVERLLRPD